jgi:trimeric autotransporter adhesin
MTNRFALASLISVAATGAANAQLIVLSDNFNSYSAGNLVGQGGWTQTSTVATNPQQVAGGANMFVQLGTSGQDVFKAFPGPVAANVGESMTSEFDINISAAQAAGDYFFHLSDPAGTSSNFYQRVFARSSAGGFQLGFVDTSGTGSTITWGSTDLSLNTSYSLRVTWNFLAGTNNDTFTLDVNGSNYLNHAWTSTGIGEPVNLSAANLRQGAAGNSATLQVDNLVVTSVPGPGSFACLLSGLILANRRRR